MLTRWAWNWHIYILQKHLLAILLADICLQRFVVSNIHGLYHSSAAQRDELHLNAKLLNLIDNSTGFVDGEVIQEDDGDYPTRCIGDVWREDLIDPIHHDLFIEPGLLLAVIRELFTKHREPTSRDGSAGLACHVTRKMVRGAEYITITIVF